MPCLEITMPSVDADTKAQLASRLTEVFAETLGFPSDIFGYHFNEYKPGTAASGGKMFDGGASRPYLHLLLFIPRPRRSVKQKLVKSLTAVDLSEVQLICMD